MVLTMPAWRAHDLATVLDRYGRIARIFQERSDFWTEDSLVRPYATPRRRSTDRPPSDRRCPAASATPSADAQWCSSRTRGRS
jgi:hypothetical protein